MGGVWLTQQACRLSSYTCAESEYHFQDEFPKPNGSKTLVQKGFGFGAHCLDHIDYWFPSSNLYRNH
jgi:hypothetical protein